MQISSVTSMSFLTDQNLTFHRFSDGTMSFDTLKARQLSSNDPSYDDQGIKRKISNLSDYQPPSEMRPTVWTTKTKYNNYSTNNPDLLMNESTTSTTRIIPDDNVATPSTLNDYSFLTTTPYNQNTNSTHHNGSTMKLITVTKDDSDQSSNQQVSFFCFWVLKLGGIER